MKDLIPIERIEQAILLIRGQKVMLDVDLAKRYGVTTFNLNKAVKRNLDRFPEDFMFQLNDQEVRNLIFQFGISSWGGTRKLPRAFTEQGVAMLSSVLKSKRAVQVNIAGTIRVGLDFLEEGVSPYAPTADLTFSHVRVSH